MYFNVANLNLHLSPKWSKIKVQKIFNLFFEYKTLESSGQELWTDDGYSTGYSKPQLGTTPGPFPDPISHLPSLCLTGSSGFVDVFPTPHPPAALRVWDFLRDYSIHIQSPYPCPRKDFFFPGFPHSLFASTTKSRMQAQSSASAMLWLHTAYTGVTPGILTQLPKPAKGMREKLVAWKKRSNIWNYYQEWQEWLWYAAGDMNQFLSN